MIFQAILRQRQNIANLHAIVESMHCKEFPRRDTAAVRFLRLLSNRCLTRRPEILNRVFDNFFAADLRGPKNSDIEPLPPQFGSAPVSWLPSCFCPTAATWQAFPDSVDRCLAANRAINEFSTCQARAVRLDLMLCVCLKVLKTKGHLASIIGCALSLNLFLRVSR